MSEFSFHFYDDVVFRAFLGAERMTKSLTGLLNSIHREADLCQIRTLTIKNPFLLETWENEKEPILDIRVVDEEGREYDVEMQCRREKYYIGRIMTYTFRLHVDQLERGTQYYQLKRTIGISLTTFPIDPSRPDLWFDVWKCRSVRGTGLGYDDLINIFVRLPSSRGEEPVGIKDPELLNWIKFLAFFPDLSDEEIASIAESTFGVGEMIQEAKMFVGTRQERELMQARERYWRDQASLRGDYEEQIRIRDAQILSMASEMRSKDSELRSKDSELRSKDSKILSMASAMRSLESEKLNSERKSIAKTLRMRFNAPVEITLDRLNGIDSSEMLDKLSDFGYECQDYDAFLKKLANFVK